MALSDCVHCWDTPCRCGYEWRHWSPEGLDRMIRTLQAVKAIKETMPNLNDDAFYIELLKRTEHRAG